MIIDKSTEKGRKTKFVNVFYRKEYYSLCVDRLLYYSSDRYSIDDRK